MPIMVPPASSVSGVLRYQWVDPSNTVRDLSRDYSPNLFIEKGSGGLNYVSFNIAESKLPLSPGSLIDKINTESRRLTLPIFVRRETLADLIFSTASLAEWFDTGDEENRRPGYFRVTRPDDTVRQILAYYVSGLEGDTNIGVPNWTKYDIELFCPDPYPTAIEDEVVIKDETNFANFGILNDGDLESYPIIQLTGPVLHFNVINTTKGQNLSGQIALNGGDTLTIDTRPSELRDGPSVYHSNGNNMLSIIHPTSVWWTLSPGLNNISFSTNTSDAATRVQITYLPRYRTLFR